MEIIKKDVEEIRNELDIINTIKTCQKLLSSISEEFITKRETNLLNELLSVTKL